MRKFSFEELAHYYHRGTSPVSFQKFSQRKSSAWSGFLIIFFTVLVLVLLSSLAGFLIFGRQVIEFKTESILTEIWGPDEIEVGQSASFSIFVKNKERIELKDVKLRLNFPEGFYLEEVSEPCAERLVSGCVWALGKIARAEKKNLEFRGYFLLPSALEKASKFSASLNFQMAGFTANFKRQIDKEVIVVPVLAIDLITPTAVFLGQENSWEIAVKNKTENEIKNIEIKFETPLDFDFSFLADSDQSLFSGRREEGASTWSLSVLKPNEKRNIFLRGHFQEIGEKKLKVGVALFGQDGHSFSQGVVEKTLLVEPTNFYCQFLGEHNLVVDWDENISISFAYENRGEDNFNDVFFKLTFNQPGYVDWQTTLLSGWQWQSEGKNISTNLWQISEDDQKKILIWQVSQIPALKQVKAGEKGKIMIFLKLVSLTQAMENFYKNAELNVDLEASGAWEDGTKTFLRADPIKLKIKTNLNQPQI